MEPRNLSDHTPYRAGRGIEEVARDLGKDPEDLIKLSSNENVLGPSPRAREAIRDSADQGHRYPKAAHTDLIEALADKWDVGPEQVWLANGGDGVLDCFSRAFLRPDDAVLVPDPGFAYYPMSARYHHGNVARYQLDKNQNFRQTASLIRDYYDGERIVVVTSPHNPTGSIMELKELENLAEETREETLVLVDEAYGEFADVPGAVSLVRRRNDVAVLRTFSKAYGLAGLRLGYGLVPAEWGDTYERVHTPFDTGEIACRAGLAALEDEDHLRKTLDMVRTAREYLYQNLKARTWESQGNFVLVEVGDATAVTRTAQEKGVILRDCSSFGLPECIRITCGTQDQMDTVVKVLNQLTAD